MCCPHSRDEEIALGQDSSWNCFKDGLTQHKSVFHAHLEANSSIFVLAPLFLIKTQNSPPHWSQKYVKSRSLDSIGFQHFRIVKSLNGYVLFLLFPLSLLDYCGFFSLLLGLKVTQHFLEDGTEPHGTHSIGGNEMKEANAWVHILWPLDRGRHIC